METVCIFVALLCVTSSQIIVHHQPTYLKEAQHLQALQQPHLPQDVNVVAATQQFLHRFAQLKALADAAPDPPPRGHTQPHAATNQQQQHRLAIPHGQILHQHHVVHTPQQQQHQPQFQQHHPQQALVILHQPHQQVHHQPQATQQHLSVPVVNHQGIVVNPNRYPGPLAHNVPANVYVG